MEIDGKRFRVMGPDPSEIPALPQTALALTPTHTRYSEALAARADLASRLHYDAEARMYATDAKAKADKWFSLAAEADYYKLAFSDPNTWSQKYNLVWNKLRTSTFSQSACLGRKPPTT